MQNVDGNNILPGGTSGAVGTQGCSTGITRFPMKFLFQICKMHIYEAHILAEKKN